MYLIDITREIDNKNDLMFGKKLDDSINKIISYIYDYCLANCGISINKGDLKNNINFKHFSLKEFMLNNYSYYLKDDLIIQTIPTDKDRNIVVKYYNKNSNELPSIYLFKQNEVKLAKGLMAYMINEELINKFSNENNFKEYEKNKKDINNYNEMTFTNGNNKFEIYNGGLFMEELLNNVCSLNQIQQDKKNIAL